MPANGRAPLRALSSSTELTGWVGARGPSTVPRRLVLARATQAACRRPCLPQRTSGGSVGSLAPNPMAASSAPSCEIRRVVVHFYPEGIKGGAHPCQQQFFGRRGKPVKKMRFVPAEKAFSIAKAMQGTKGCTVSVI